MLRRGQLSLLCSAAVRGDEFALLRNRSRDKALAAAQSNAEKTFARAVRGLCKARFLLTTTAPLLL